jgi:hypothetical protein
MEMILKKILLYMLFPFGLLSSSQFVSAQLRVIDNKGTISVVDESKWTRIGVTNDIYNKFLGNVGIGTNSPVATLHNAGSTLFGTLTLTNFGANAYIGAAAATVNAYTSINIPQTTAGITLTLPTPGNTTAGRVLQVSNTGTSPVTVEATLIGTAQTARFVYNGTVWTNPTGGVTVGTTTTAQANGASITGATLNLSVADATNPGLVSTTAQTIAGAKTWNGLGTFNAGLTATGGAINLNASTAYTTNIGNGTNNLILLGTTDINQSGSANTRIGNTTGTLTLEGGMAATAIQIGNGATAHGIQIGTGAAVNALVLGSTNSTSKTTIQGGSGIDAITIDPATGGDIVIGDAAGTGAITLGNSSAAQTVNVGKGAGASTVNIANGLAGNTVSIANGANTTAQTINIGAGANAANNTINIGSGTNTAGITAVTIGTNTNFANTTLIEGGNDAGAITLTPQITGSIVIGATAGTGDITLGNSSAAQTVNVGNGAGASAVNIGSTAANSIVKVKSPLLRTIGVAIVVTVTGTLSAANMAKGSVFQYTGAANVALTLATGTDLSTALPGVAVGDMISFVVSNNTTARTISMTGGVGTTLGVTGITVAARQSRTFYAINTGTNTWTIY